MKKQKNISIKLLFIITLLTTSGSAYALKFASMEAQHEFCKSMKAKNEEVAKKLKKLNEKKYKMDTELRNKVISEGDMEAKMKLDKEFDEIKSQLEDIREEIDQASCNDFRIKIEI